MRELSTADLAGGASRPKPTSDLSTRDAEHSVDRTRSGVPVEQDEFDQNTSRPSDAGMAAVSGRSSTLPNPAATDGAHLSDATPLFPPGEAEAFRSRWTDVQTGFVDEPRTAVEQADSMVAEMMQRLAQVFAEERAKLEEQWSRGDDISTEDLRQALRRYRSFFDRLLQV